MLEDNVYIKCHYLSIDYNNDIVIGITIKYVES